MSTQEFLLARVEALENKVKQLNAELKLENENKRSHVVGLQLQIEALNEELKNANSDMNLHISTLDGVIGELIHCIKGLDPTNEILSKSPFKYF